MTAPATPVPKAAAYDLASRIYVELVGRSVGQDGGAKLLANAEALASMSLKLAESFFHADQKAEAAKAPVTNFKLDSADMATWTPAAPPKP